MRAVALVAVVHQHNVAGRDARQHESGSCIGIARERIATVQRPRDDSQVACVRNARELVAAATFIRDNGAALRENFVLFVQAMGTGLKMAVDFFKPVMDLAASDLAKFLFTPLDQTTDDILRNQDVIGPKQRQPAEGSARQAGMVAGAKNFGDIRVGDINITMPSTNATPEDVGKSVQQQLMSLVQDL